jgi:hypothetical protein
VVVAIDLERVRKGMIVAQRCAESEEEGQENPQSEYLVFCLGFELGIFLIQIS